MSTGLLAFPSRKGSGSGCILIRNQFSKVMGGPWSQLGLDQGKVTSSSRKVREKEQSDWEKLWCTNTAFW